MTNYPTPEEVIYQYDKNFWLQGNPREINGTALIYAEMRLPGLSVAHFVTSKPERGTWKDCRRVVKYGGGVTTNIRSLIEDRRGDVIHLGKFAWPFRGLPASKFMRGLHLDDFIQIYMDLANHRMRIGLDLLEATPEQKVRRLDHLINLHEDHNREGPESEVREYNHYQMKLRLLMHYVGSDSPFKNEADELIQNLRERRNVVMMRLRQVLCRAISEEDESEEKKIRSEIERLEPKDRL